MHRSSLWLFRKKKILYLVLFLYNALFVSCSLTRETPPEAFLKKLLLEEGGIYTLLGDKPITDVLIYIGNEQDISLDGLSNESLQKIEYVDDHTFENWNSWKEFAKNLKIKNFRFIERPCLRDPLHKMYLFVNTEKLKDLLQKRKDVFSNEIGMSVDIERTLNELDDPQSTFWNRAFANHYTCGLLHGYGDENCQHFIRIINDDSTPTFSEKFQGPITQNHFPLPVFATSVNDSATDKYHQQRKHIQQLYKKKNFLKTTLTFLEKEQT